MKINRPTVTEITPELQSCISEYSTGRFQMRECDVRVGWTGSTSRRRKKAKQSRRLDITARTITMKHRLTGVELIVRVKPGHYSKKELRKLCDKAVQTNLKYLEQDVRQFLKTCVARQFGPPELQHESLAAPEVGHGRIETDAEWEKIEAEHDKLLYEIFGRAIEEAEWAQLEQEELDIPF